MTTTPKGIRKIDLTFAPNVPQDLDNLADDVDARLPAFGSEPTKINGLLWVDSTTATLRVTDGTSWFVVAGREQSGTVSNTIPSGASSGAFNGSQPFPVAYSTAPQIVVPNCTTDENIQVNILTWSITGFTYRAFLTSGTVPGIPHSFSFAWRSFGGS